MANQTIIKAAGQRYAPIKTDYSGYIQGLTSIATALINKEKQVREKVSKIEDLKRGVTTSIEPWADHLKWFLNSDDFSYETKVNSMEKLNKGTKKLEELQIKMGNLLDPQQGPGLSKSIDPIVKNWILSYANGDFDQEFSVYNPVYNEDEVQIGTEQKTFNMNMLFDQDFNTVVMGPYGEWITTAEMEDFLNIAESGDGQQIVDILSGFGTSSNVKKYKDNTAQNIDNFNAEFESTINEINNLFKFGDGKISGGNMKNSFIFDMEFEFKGETRNFIQWYMSNYAAYAEGKDREETYYGGGYMGDDDYRDRAEKEILRIKGDDDVVRLEDLDNEEIMVLAQDMIKNDPNIEEDIQNWLKYLLNLYK